MNKLSEDHIKKARDRYDYLSDKCKMTVCDLRKQLEIFPDNYELLFTYEGEPVMFNRTKMRGDTLLTIELNSIEYL